MPLGSDGGSAHQPSSPEASLFPIFMLSMLTLVLVPSTLCAPPGRSQKPAGPRRRPRGRATDQHAHGVSCDAAARPCAWCLDYVP